MKRKTVLFVVAILSSSTVLFAQMPEKFSYQAVVRNASNTLVSNALVCVHVSILQGSVTGNAVYVETHTAVTNANGLLTIEIGGGTAQQGIFADVDWSEGPYFLKTEIDPDGGTNYSITSTQLLLSVPYALYAKESGNGFSGDYNDLINAPTIPTVPTNVSVFNNDIGYLTSYTEQQVLSISHDTIFLTGGSFVKLPAGFNGDYNSLTNKPTIPMIPTNVSAFTNDMGYITMDSVPAIPTNISTFINDAGYLTEGELQSSITVVNNSFYLLENAISDLYNTIDSLRNRIDELESFHMPPTVITDSVSRYNRLWGTVVSDGGLPITNRGFCYDTLPNPSMENNVVYVGEGASSFETTIVGLPIGNLYYVRSFASNVKGTAYGNQLSFYVDVNGQNISLNELIGGDTILNGGKYYFSVPDTFFTGENLIIYSKAKYHVVDSQNVTNNVPEIWISGYGSVLNQRDSTIKYVIGKEDDLVLQQWRIPNLPPVFTNVRVTIAVPVDKQLIIHPLEAEDYNEAPNSTTSKIRINAHGSPWTGMFNTQIGFEYAAKAGYPCCVAVPKRTSDGVWVCFHDDDNCNGLRYANGVVNVCKKNTNGTYTQYDESGNVIGDNPMPISSLTWEFLQDKIVYKGNYYGIWGVQHIPTLEDFFRVCARTGMIPMLSVHPALTASEWQEIKNLAERCGVLNMLNLKLRKGDGYVDPAVQVFGNSIRRYSIYVTSEEEVQWSLNKLSSVGNVCQESFCIELTRAIAQKQLIEQITNNGFTCSVFDYTRNVTGKWLKETNSWGVTEYTTDFNHSAGLNW